MYHFLYLIQTSKDLYTNIYKIGKTTQLPEERFKGYDKESYPLRISLVDNCSERETELILLFNNKFKLNRGREYFEGDIEEMIFEFCNLCNQKEIIKNTLKQFDIMKTNEIIQFCNSRKIEKINKDTNIYLNTIKNDINNFECHKCFRIFKTKQQLQNHENSKNKCDIITNFQCKTCLKYFKSKQNLLEHKSCKVFNIDKINDLKKDTHIYINTLKNDHNNFKCEICLSEFTQKIGLQKHMNKKNKCDIITDFQCNKCLKYFKYNKNLVEHTNKKNCDEKIIIEDKIELQNNDNIVKINAIKAIINCNSFDIDSKINLLKKYNISLSVDEIKIIITSSMNITDIINTLLSFIT
jgi:hypothetical protein